MFGLERKSLRTRIALFFALIGAVNAALLIIGAIWLSIRLEGASGHAVLVLGTIGFAITGLIVWVALKFDENLAIPLRSLANDLKTLAHSDGQALRSDDQGRYLGMIGPAANEVSQALLTAREKTETRIEEALRSAEVQRQELESLLRDLSQGIVICTLTGRVTLYNRRAVSLLHVDEFNAGDDKSTDVVVGSLGLGRDFFNVVDHKPFKKALDAMQSGYSDGNPLPLADQQALPLVFSTCDGALTLRGHISLRLNRAGNAPTGFVCVFDDITAELSEGIERDRVLRDAIGTLKSVLDQYPDTRAADPVNHAIAQLENASSNIIASAWPMADISTTRIFTTVRQMLNAKSNSAVLIDSEPVILHADMATLISLLRQIMHVASEDFGATKFSLSAKAEGRQRSIFINHDASKIDPQKLCAALDNNADPDTSFLSGNQIIDRHRADLKVAEKQIVLNFPNNTAATAARLNLTPQDARPEFYDFDLFEREYVSDLLDVPLSRLHCVVFDCEMTGLDPRGRDEIVSIAGARVVNGRVLTGETFNQLVNPGRKIPESSTRIHHISDEMVKDAPPVSIALKRFHAFAKDQVLIAHNAAFDMAFLTKGQAKANVRFDNVVLDTVLLAAHLHGATGELTLDALAERFKVVIKEEDRHTALGDAIATAHIFTALVKLLEAEGVITLRDALQVSEAQTALRRRQKAYS